MSEQEVIQQVQGHLQGMFPKIEKLSKKEKQYCIKMIMDFLGKTKKEAEDIFTNKVLPGLTFYSGNFTPVRYKDNGSTVIITSQFDGLNLEMYKENLVAFGQELIKLGKSYQCLEGGVI